MVLISTGNTQRIRVKVILFEDLVSALSSKLQDKGYLLSIAVISGVGDDENYADLIDSTVFDDVNFVNVRAFNTSNSDNLQSSKQDAIDSIDYWTERCLIKNKLVLGIPLFADNGESFDQIVNESRSYACTDNSKSRDYNGIPTVVDKTEYAMKYAGGMMMQSLDQDAYREYPTYSLLDAIKETVDGNIVTICD